MFVSISVVIFVLSSSSDGEEYFIDKLFVRFCVESSKETPSCGQGTAQCSPVSGQGSGGNGGSDSVGWAARATEPATWRAPRRPRASARSGSTSAPARQAKSTVAPGTEKAAAGGCGGAPEGFISQESPHPRRRDLSTKHRG